MITSKNISIREFPLPDAKDLEQQLLTDIIASPEVIGDAMRFVTADCFTTDQRKHLWQTAVSMYGRGEIVDMSTMLTVEGNAFIDECINSGKLGGTPRTAIQHAIYLRDAAARRRTYFAAVEMLRSSVDTNNTEADLCAMGENLGRRIQGNAGGVTERPIGDVMDRIEAEMDEKQRLAKEGKSVNVPTGLESLNWFTYGGWKGGQLIILAARPSVGKTALMVKMAHAAAAGGFPTTIFSLEMTDKELGQRLLYSTGRIKPAELVSGNAPRDTFKEISNEFRKLPFTINDRSRSLDEIVARMVINAHAGNCKVAFIDYLGLMNIEMSRGENMSQVIGKITSELKAVAKRLNIPIILLCQLNRQAAKDDRAPELYDLRDSGSIEQDADIVLMLENDPAVNPDTGLKDINIWLRKNRQYKKDICIKVRPNATYSEFVEVSADITNEHATAAALGSGNGLTDDEDEDNEQTLFD